MLAWVIVKTVEWCDQQHVNISVDLKYKITVIFFFFEFRLHCVLGYKCCRGYFTHIVSFYQQLLGISVSMLIVYQTFITIPQFIPDIW